MSEPAAATSWRALGTTVVVLTSDPGDLDGAAERVRAVIDQIDLACSRFREDSELSIATTAATAASSTATAASRWRPRRRRVRRTRSRSRRRSSSELSSSLAGESATPRL